jgi:ferredoxin-thioredoxin reductase catalytic chain
MNPRPKEESLQRIRKFVEKFCVKSGTFTHPDKEVTECVVLGLAANLDSLGNHFAPAVFIQTK